MHYHGLIFDLGVSEGTDTAFYLAKGFKVVAVEADPAMVRHLRARFSTEIGSGAVKLLPFAAADSFGDVLDFHAHAQYQGVSGLSLNPDLSPDGYQQPQQVMTIDWATLLAQGIPHYVKIDIENNETTFLAGMARTGVVPEFISVECHALDPVRQLFAMGYRRFRLIDQNSRDGFLMPEPQLEGRRVENPDFAHASGPFGMDVFGGGAWLDFSGFEAAWSKAQPTRAHGTWFDCHAWKPHRRGFAGWLARSHGRARSRRSR